jgi:hypothetical protein
MQPVQLSQYIESCDIEYEAVNNVYLSISDAESAPPPPLGYSLLAYVIVLTQL